MPQTKRHSAGFSLLEMVVAMAILAISLGMMYQAVGGATRNVRSDEKYAYAVELARSLLAGNAKVPLSGMSSKGITNGDFSWQVNTAPIEMPGSFQPGALQDIVVSVSWPDRGSSKEIILSSVVEGYSR